MRKGNHIITSSNAASEAPEPRDADTTPVAEDLSAVLAVLVAERDKLAAEKSELQERLLRRQAEFENFRKRAQREREEYLEFAGAGTMEALLPILDDFERALKTECADKEYARGTELIFQRLLDTAKKLGLEPLPAVGEKFDPNLHHAVDRVQSAEAEDDTVLDELQRGYNYRGRLLRPAMVRVAYKG
jgi:molecular chaperone GrpE